MISRSMMMVAAAAMLAAVPAVARDRADEPQRVMPNGDPVICKKTQDTGSLVKKTKRCYTQAQWNRIADAARANGQRMQSDHTSGEFYN